MFFHVLLGLSRLRTVIGMIYALLLLMFCPTSRPMGECKIFAALHSIGRQRSDLWCCSVFIYAIFLLSKAIIFGAWYIFVPLTLVFVRWFGGLEYGKWKWESGACSFRTHRTLYSQISPDIKGAMWSCIGGGRFPIFEAEIEIEYLRGGRKANLNNGIVKVR